MPRTPRAQASLKQRATGLRNDPTSAEQQLWAYLRLKRTDGLRFRRQHAIGPYVVDFCAPEAHMIIELDGSQHIARTARDNKRTRYLESEGYRVLRFWNDKVINDIEGVMRAIHEALAEA